MDDATSLSKSAEEPLRIGVLGSGKGSNFRALAEQIESGRIHAVVACVGTDVSGAGIIDFARGRGYPTFSIEAGKFKSTLEQYVENRLVQTLNGYHVDLIVLAGFMRIFKYDVLHAFAGRIINIHPSLLPKYKGMYAWRQALNAGDSVTGCTVHYVDSGVDTGEIIAQSEVEIRRDDTPETLHARIQEAEHRLLPQVVQQFSTKREEFLKQAKTKIF